MINDLHTPTTKIAHNGIDNFRFNWDRILCRHMGRAGMGFYPLITEP